MNDTYRLRVGDVFAHRTLTIKTPFTPVPFTATFEVLKVMKDKGMVRLRALHDYRLGASVGHRNRATLVTELPNPHGAEFTTFFTSLKEHYVFLRHADDGGI